MINLEITIKDGRRDNNGLLNMSIKNLDIKKPITPLAPKLLIEEDKKKEEKKENKK